MCMEFPGVEGEWGLGKTPSMGEIQIFSGMQLLRFTFTHVTLSTCKI